ncbi:MAG TPA: tetratricopeptide repeat protein [Terriglobales bacterium]|nr:tetratricopeptide repeat protein [Terriglobales bacterium]
MTFSRLQIVLAIATLGAPIAFPQSQPASVPSNQTQPATASTGRAPIRTKTQEEYKAYQTAISNELIPENMEKAADDFASKFPDSEVRVLLYRAAMSSYQTSGNPQKMMDMGLKVLAIDKEDPEALIGVAEVLEERTAPTDLDRAPREAQVIDYATHALRTVDTDLAVPAGTPPDKIEAYKKYLRSTALALLGSIYYKQENYSEAEAKLRDALGADPANTDPVVVLRLALALDQEKKYADALQQANHAVELTKENTDLGTMARNERDRLIVQTGGSPTSVPAAPNSTSTPPQAPAQPAAPANPASAPATSAPTH